MFPGESRVGEREEDKFPTTSLHGSLILVSPGMCKRVNSVIFSRAGFQTQSSEGGEALIQLKRKEQVLHSLDRENYKDHSYKPQLAC